MDDFNYFLLYQTYDLHITISVIKTDNKISHLGLNFRICKLLNIFATKILATNFSIGFSVVFRKAPMKREKMVSSCPPNLVEVLHP